MARLGLDYDTLEQLNPQLIVIARFQALARPGRSARARLTIRLFRVCPG